MMLSLVTGVLAAALTLAAVVAQGVRWLRVLQREHYAPRPLLRFVGRWNSTPLLGSSKLPGKTPLLLATLQIAVIVTLVVLGFELVAVVLLSIGAWFLPLGLGRRGRTSPLAWTRRLRTVAVVASLVDLVIAGSGFAFGHPAATAAVGILAVPFAVAFAALVTAPFEDRLAQSFVAQARERLVRVAPTVVAITGSYGKTSTKHHLAELLGSRHGIVPTPRSFNNRAGLSRAINENLTDGSTVFIAEMGTYGLGEIAALCEWCPPTLSVVTSIGPVHLERMKSLENIATAKYEITERASTVVLNTDDPILASWVDRLNAEGKRVVTAGSVSEASVRVVSEAERWLIIRDGVTVAEVLPVAGVHETNLACAIAAAFELGADPYEVATRISHLTPAQHRLTVVTAPSGLTIIDDTFNANPASARSALALLGSIPSAGRRVVVTPGLIELGPEQEAANVTVGRDVAALGATLISVARTNAGALRTGFGTSCEAFATRELAVSWVRANLGATDVVLYLNDLPDHYP